MGDSPTVLYDKRRGGGAVFASATATLPLSVSIRVLAVSTLFFRFWPADVGAFEVMEAI
jgi:hypothetical protein